MARLSGNRGAGVNGAGSPGDARREPAPAARLEGVCLRYGKTVALEDINLDIPAGRMVGLIGPDGVGKSSLLALLSGVRVIQAGSITALGGNMADARHRERVRSRIAYMPQGLGSNLYATLSVEENMQFFGRLFGQDAAERRARIDALTTATGLHPFLDRPAGKLSGGMKQKLGLCCSLIRDPDLLILDEPTTGVDPLARAQFWRLIERVRAERPGMTVLAATAYMDEAKRFDWLVAMYGGKVPATGTPDDLLQRTGSKNLEEAFIRLLPEKERVGHRPVEILPLEDGGRDEIAVEAEGLTKRFGSFTAVDNVGFAIRRGEIFGFLGSNGCGKTTTMKMLTGLLPATEGTVRLFGREVDPGDTAARERLGYMTQSFSLYGELTVRQNLVLHARLFRIPETEIPGRVQAMLERFELIKVADSLPKSIPLGLRQRLSLAVALIHRPEMLILDEPTSGVDPVARDGFWRLLMETSRKDKVTIFISTHFMNEAERCDRISLMHAGKVLAGDTPAALVEKRRAKNLEEAFIAYLIDAGAGTEGAAGAVAGTKAGADAGVPGAQTADPAAVLKNTGEGAGAGATPDAAPGAQGVEATAVTAAKHEFGPGPLRAGGKKAASARQGRFSFRRLYSCMWRESLELMRDPIRATLALLGSLILMVVMGYGITMDVENLTYAVLDRDGSGLSGNYALALSGSRYFTEKPPLADHADLDRRMADGDITMAVEFPPNFGRDVQRGSPVEIGVWVDGAMPQRAETISGYVKGMHQTWLREQAVQRRSMTPAPTAGVEIRYRYNPDVKSLPAMVPAVIPLLLIMLPAMLAALAVVREKELGSIINFYTTPLTRAEFLLGKQAPYVVLSMAGFLLMALMAVTLFDVPIKGSFFTLSLAAFLYCIIATGMGLFASTFIRSQIAAMFVTMIGTMLPAIQFSGLLNTVSSLEGAGRAIGEVYPTTHMLIITRGVFNKALGLTDLYGPLTALLVTVPVILAAGILLLKKQAD